MGIVARQTIKSSLFVYLGVFVGMITRLYLYPKFMTPEQIGFIGIYFTIGMVLSQIAMLGSTTTFSKYFEYFKKKDLLPVFYSLFILISFIGGVISTAILYIWKEPLIGFFSKDSAIILEYFHFIPILLFFIIYNHVFTIFAHNNLRLTVPSILNDFGVKLITALGIVIWGLGYITFTQFVIIFTCAFLLADVGLLFYSLFLFKIRFSIALNRIQKDEYRDLRNYSFFIFVGGFSGSIITYADTLMLSSLEGLDAAGIYSIAFFMGSVIEVPKRAIGAISTPLLAKHWLEEKTNEIDKLYKQSSINQGIIGMLLLMLLWINIDNIFFFIPNSDIYIAGKYVALFIGMARVTDMFMGINSEILRTSKKYYYDLAVTVLFIAITIGTNLALIPILQLNGAAVASLISVLLYNIMRYAIIKRLYSLSPFSQKSWVLIGIFTALFLLYYVAELFIPSANTYLESAIYIALKSSIWGGLAILAIYRLKVSEEFNRIVNSMRNKFF